MLAPPQSLHSLLRQLCSQMLAPPLSLHLFLWRLHLFLWRSPLRCAHPLPLPPLGAAEGVHAADGLAAHGAGEGAFEQRGTAGGGRHQPARDLKRYNGIAFSGAPPILILARNSLEPTSTADDR